MTPLEQAAGERMTDFFDQLRKYKADEKLTLAALAEECELSITQVRNFCCAAKPLNKQGPSAKSILQIEMATGIRL